MELDDLKNDWNKAGEYGQTPGYNLTELISQESSAPLNNLKVRYRKQVILLPLAAGTLAFGMTQKTALQNNSFIWFIIPVLLLLALMYYRAYRLVVKMEQTTAESLKNSIRQNVALLQQNARQQLYFTRGILMLFIILLEASMYHHTTGAFQAWHKVILPGRLILYALLLVIQPYLTRYFFNLSFGRYINRLQLLLNQAD